MVRKIGRLAAYHRYRNDSIRLVRMVSEILRLPAVGAARDGSRENHSHHPGKPDGVARLVAAGLAGQSCSPSGQAGWGRAREGALASRAAGPG